MLFIEVEVNKDEFLKVKTGIETWLKNFTRNLPRKLDKHKEKGWKMGYFNRGPSLVRNGSIFKSQTYWLTYWKEKSKAHITLKPGVDGWSVYYNHNNSMFGGRLVEQDLDFNEGLKTANEYMNKVNQTGQRAPHYSKIG